MAKFRASRRRRFEDTKRIMSPEIRPKSFGTFEKQAPEQEQAVGVKDLISWHRSKLLPCHLVRIFLFSCGPNSLPKANAHWG